MERTTLRIVSSNSWERGISQRIQRACIFVKPLFVKPIHFIRMLHVGLFARSAMWSFHFIRKCSSLGESVRPMNITMTLLFLTLLRRRTGWFLLLISHFLISSHILISPPLEFRILLEVRYARLRLPGTFFKREPLPHQKAHYLSYFGSTLGLRQHPSWKRRHHPSSSLFPWLSLRWRVKNDSTTICWKKLQDCLSEDVIKNASFVKRRLSMLLWDAPWILPLWDLVLAIWL